MRLVLINRRALVGLHVAMLLVAAGPRVANAQQRDPRVPPPGYGNAVAPHAGVRANGQVKRESLMDQGMRWPTMPFSRKKPQEQTSVANQPRTATNRAMPASSQRLQQVPMQRRNMAANSGMPMAERRSLPKGYVMPSNAGVPPQVAPRSQYTAPPSLPAAQSMRQPQTTHAVPALRPAQTSDRQPSAAPVAVQSPASENPAVQLLSQAHEWSATAQSEQEYTRIINACSKARASVADAAIAAYANDLAAWALNRRGQLQADAGREREALADFNAAITANASCWRAIHNRGVLSAQAGEFAPAFDDFSRTIHLNPKFAKAYSNRAALFVVAGNIQPAIQDFKSAIGLDPELSVAHRGLGRACHLAGDLDESIRHYDEAIGLSPNDAYAIASRADVLTDLGQYAKAATEYDRAIQLDASSGQAHSGSAWLLATCPDDAVRNTNLAIERAQQAVKLTGGNDAASLDTLAAAQASAGDFATAQQTVQQAIQMANENEKQAFESRRSLYEQQTPYRLSPIEIAQASHEETVK